jgi:hypothetical protein
MNDNSDGYLNDPLDDEFDAAVISAAQLIAHTKRIGLTELELPVEDEAHVWSVVVKRMGIGEKGHASGRSSERMDS